MRILFLTHRVPFPPDKGDRIRSYNIIKFLAHSHSISLMSVSHDPVHPKTLETLSQHCESVEIFKINSKLSKLKSCFHLFTQSPLTLSVFYSRHLDRAIKNKLGESKFDLIYIYSSPMAQYVLSAGPIPKLMDFIDVDSQKWFDYAEKVSQPMKTVYFREGTRLRCFEKRVASLCDWNVVASERELKVLEQVAPDAKSIAFPNGVDLNFKNGHSYRQYKLVFVGSMDYFPNIDAMIYFTREILPLVQKEIPDVELAIVGRNPSRQIKALGRVKNITVTGYVKEVDSYLRDAAATVIPLRIARGIQTKVLEAMAHGVPVIGTSAALDGINATPGKDLLSADTPQSFAQNTVAVLKDRNLRHQLAMNALALVQREYSWGTRLKGLEDTLISMCRR